MEQKICTITDCEKEVNCRGWCTTHYGRYQRFGIPDAKVRKQESHGMKDTPEYCSWVEMRQRCLRVTHKRYKDYGGRGIKVHEPWVNSFIQFYEDLGQRPAKNYSLERINNDGNYEPGNVRWASVKEQANNRRSSRFIVFKNKRKTMAQWAEEIGLSYATIQHRLDRGWDVEKAFTTGKLR